MGYKILIVDDEKMITDQLSEHLQDCGYDTLVANSSSGAMTLLQKQPDLIILDINMPGKSPAKRRNRQMELGKPAGICSPTAGNQTGAVSLKQTGPVNRRLRRKEFFLLHCAG